MKKGLLLIAIIIFPLSVYATGANTPVSNNLTFQECLDFQDKRISTSGSGYLGYCKKATCQTGVWKVVNQNGASTVLYCNNGNNDPYTYIERDGCRQYRGTCTPTINYKYCSQVQYYDCTKKKDGSRYSIPTSTKVTTQKVTTRRPTTTRRTTTTKKVPTNPTTTTTTTTTTTPTTTTKPLLENNNYLKTLTISEGTIEFNKEKLIYNIEIEPTTTELKVEAIPESSKARVEVSNPGKINNGSVITITVTAEDKTERVYTININHKVPEKSSNNKIEKIDIKGYSLNFNPNKTNYKLKVAEETTKLDITATPQDEKSKVTITGNDKLKNGSKINIVVTAENGKEQKYTIKIKKNNNTIIGVIVLLVAGVALVVAFKLIRKIIPGRKDSNYDYE